MSNDAKVNFDLPTGIQNLDVSVNYTSQLYPIIEFDATTAAGSVEGLRFWAASVDAVAPAGTVSTIELRPVLQAAVVEPGATAAAGEVTAIELKTVLLNIEVDLGATADAYNPNVDATAATGEVTAINLQSLLVSHEQLPDATTATGTVTGIALN